MERREKINKFKKKKKKIPKVMSEHRCHLSFRIIRVAILYSKEVESVKHFSLSRQERKGIPLLYKGKGVFLSYR